VLRDGKIELYLKNKQDSSYPKLDSVIPQLYRPPSALGDVTAVNTHGLNAEDVPA